MEAQAVEIWLLVLACGAGTYLWRVLGVAAAGRVAAHGEILKWVTCVAYAMVAGLIARMIALPTGLLAQSAFVERAAACAAALAVFHLAGRNLFLAVAAGVAVLTLLVFLRLGA